MLCSKNVQHDMNLIPWEWQQRGHKYNYCYKSTELVRRLDLRCRACILKEHGWAKRV